MPIPLTRPRSDQELASPPRGIVTRPKAPLPGGTPEGPLHDLREHLAASRQHLDQIARALKAVSTGPPVLETATITLPSTGIWTQDHYRVPFAAVAILNTGAGTLTVTTGPPQGEAPGGGQGMILVPAGSFLSVNVAGSILTFYGTAGAQITYSVMTGRINPSASIVAAAS